MNFEIRFYQEITGIHYIITQIFHEIETTRTHFTVCSSKYETLC